MTDCLFCRIVAGEIPSKKVFEDEHTFAFEDIDPKAPTHVLVVPKKHIRGLKEASAEEAEIIGQLPSDGGAGGAAARHRKWLPDGAECRAGCGPVSVSPARAFAGRTEFEVAARIGKQQH